MKTIALLFGVILISCSDDIVSECNIDIKGADAVQPTLSSIQSEIFSKKCASSGCHGSIEPVMGLDLSNGKSHKSLVGISTPSSQKKYVEPSNAQQSFLVDKLRGNGTSSMPPTGMLPNIYIEAVEEWINAGALDN